jgi:hypothetical protein
MSAIPRNNRRISTDCSSVATASHLQAQCYAGSLNWTEHRAYSMPGFTVWPKATTYSCPLLYSQISSMTRIRATHEHSIRPFKTGCLRTRNDRDGQMQNRLQCVTEMPHTCGARVWGCVCVCVPRTSAAFCSEMQQADGEVPAIYLSHTHTHTHTTLTHSHIHTLSHTHTHSPHTHTHTHTLSKSVNGCNL